MKLHMTKEWYMRAAELEEGEIGAGLSPLHCAACEGRGYIWTVPSGFNPFEAEIDQIAKVSQKVPCSCASGKAFEKSTGQ